MGNPSIYYKMCLQGLCYYLVCQDNMKLAEELDKETDIKKLESIVLEKKKEISKEQFYYAAGMASMSMVADVMQNDGCDGMNASIGGLAEFEYFIGIREDDEEEEEGKD